MAYRIRKWRPKQQTAASDCCKLLYVDQGEFETMKMQSKSIFIVKPKWTHVAT